MKHPFFSTALLSALFALSAPAETILIDYDDGDAGNGVHNAIINDGDFGLQSVSSVSVLPWVTLTTAEYQTNNQSGVGSNQNFVANGGADAATGRRIGIDASGTSGYTLAVGHSLKASFMARPAANWDATDTMALRLFYTADDTVTGVATPLAEFVFTGRYTAVWSAETFAPVAVVDPAAAGKKLFASVQTATPGTTTVSGEFCRIDNIFVAVETTSISPLLVVNPTAAFTNTGISTNYSIPISNNSVDGSTPLLVSGVVAAGAASGAVSNISFPASVPYGASDAITFDFAPGSGGGTYLFNIQIASNDQSEASPRIVQVTMVVKDPVIAVAATSVDLGTFTSSGPPATATVTVSNTGGASNLVIDNLTTVITGDSEFTISSLPGPIAPGASGVIELTFTPGAVEGLFTGTLTIGSNDYLNTTPAVALRALVFPSGPVAAADFGTAGSPVAADYSQFIVAEAATQTLAGVAIQMKSKNADIVSYTTAGAGDLMADGAATTFNGGAGNFISILLSGFADGTLHFVSSHNYPSSLSLPLQLSFGEQGGTLTSVQTNVTRPAAVEYSATVEAGKTYELRVLESGNADLAYISGLLLWGDAVPGGTAFDSFVANAGLDPATTGQPDLDPDLDGVETGVEWVLGGSPNNSTNPDTAKLPVGAKVTADPDGDLTASDYLRFSYRRTNAAANDPDTSIAVQYGDDLSGWTAAVNGTDGVVIVVTDEAIDLVEVYIPTSLGMGGSLFARLSVVISTP